MARYVLGVIFLGNCIIQSESLFYSFCVADNPLCNPLCQILSDITSLSIMVSK
jgi:hypothetical protein